MKSTAKNKVKKLSDVPSEILMQAMEDLEIVESMPKKFSVNMGVWFEPRFSKVCVCHAGAVMAITLEADRKQAGTGIELGPVLNAKMDFINAIRVGDFESAFQFLYQKGVIDRREKNIALNALGNAERHIPENVSLYLSGYQQEYKNYICAVIGTLQSVDL